MTSPARIKQADVTRVVKGVQAAGLEIARIEIEPNGTIKVFTAPDAQSELTGWEDA